ncbi:hypothetical protein DUNSADRAFT_6715 [Dunaliella salina]|uniref:Uncharacterized protein n=1 Tax=Dunaliella salina TaxID=3046 RepID=A0ABQ7GMS6_DUNSA|nr:hypothetical protein DUNSADRAFT_6715 [Dunaliella salina]|eukprot:KAF5835902.1 hypothetical protein DUNSADRAFT_6715 [Dunaliella salina]
MRLVHVAGVSNSCTSSLGLTGGCLGGCKITLLVPVRQRCQHVVAQAATGGARTSGVSQDSCQGSARVSKAQILTSAPPPPSSQVPLASLGQPPLLLGVLWVLWIVTRKLVLTVGHRSGIGGVSSGSSRTDYIRSSSSRVSVGEDVDTHTGWEHGISGSSGRDAVDEGVMMEGGDYADGAEQGDLGRVMICARLPAPTSSAEAHAAAFSDVLEAWSGGALGPFPGGLLLVFPKTLLVCIEAGNHQLMALLRASLADAEWREQHGILEARVS